MDEPSAGPPTLTLLKPHSRKLLDINSFLKMHVSPSPQILVSLDIYILLTRY